MHLGLEKYLHVAMHISCFPTNSSKNYIVPGHPCLEQVNPRLTYDPNKILRLDL